MWNTVCRFIIDKIGIVEWAPKWVKKLRNRTQIKLSLRRLPCLSIWLKIHLFSGRNKKQLRIIISKAKLTCLLMMCLNVRNFSEESFMVKKKLEQKFKSLRSSLSILMYHSTPECLFTQAKISFSTNISFAWSSMNFSDWMELILHLVLDWDCIKDLFTWKL